MGGGGCSSVTDIIQLVLFCELCTYAEEIKHLYDTITNLLYSNSNKSITMSLLRALDLQIPCCKAD